MENGKKIASIILPDNANVFNVGDQLDLIVSKQIKFEVTKRTYIAHFSETNDTDLGEPNSFGWLLDVQSTQQN